MPVPNDAAKTLQTPGRRRETSKSPPCLGRGPTHLPIDGPDDGGLDPHAADEADVEILVQHEGLEAGADEQQHRVEVAVPVRGRLVVHKVDEQSAMEGGQSPG